jgi:hypothetical protein
VGAPILARSFLGIWQRIAARLPLLQGGTPLWERQSWRDLFLGSGKGSRQDCRSYKVALRCGSANPGAIFFSGLARDRGKIAAPTRWHFVVGAPILARSFPGSGKKDRGRIAAPAGWRPYSSWNVIPAACRRSIRRSSQAITGVSTPARFGCLASSARHMAVSASILAVSS